MQSKKLNGYRKIQLKDNLEREREREVQRQKETIEASWMRKFKINFKGF